MEVAFALVILANAENGMQYFPSNVIMVFLPGIHMLDQCLSVRDVTSIVLIGANVTDGFNSSIITHY